MNIPWKTKSRLYRLLSYMPSGALYFAQRNITKRSRVNITEIHEGWHHHMRVAKQYGSKNLIEFGAGKTLAQNLYLSTVVESQTVVDLFHMVEIDMVNEAITQLIALGVPLKASRITSIEDIQDTFNIRYLAPFDMADTDFADGTFDLCASTNTLEHIPGADIARIFKELHRVMAPGGIVSAMIDYSDHYAHSDKSINRLHYLQFSEADWAKHNHDNHYQNRLRHNHHKALMTTPGFDVLEENPTDYCELGSVMPRTELITDHESDLSTTGFWVLQKPQATT